jgi:hypothetical protein
MEVIKIDSQEYNVAKTFGSIEPSDWEFRNQ